MGASFRHRRAPRGRDRADSVSAPALRSALRHRGPERDRPLRVGVPGGRLGGASVMGCGGATSDAASAHRARPVRFRRSGAAVGVVAQLRRLHLPLDGYRRHRLRVAHGLPGPHRQLRRQARRSRWHVGDRQPTGTRPAPPPRSAPVRGRLSRLRGRGDVGGRRDSRPAATSSGHLRVGGVVPGSRHSHLAAARSGWSGRAGDASRLSLHLAPARPAPARVVGDPEAGEGPPGLRAVPCPRDCPRLRLRLRGQRGPAVLHRARWWRRRFSRTGRRLVLPAQRRRPGRAAVRRRVLQ